MKSISININELTLEKVLSIVPDSVKNKQGASFVVFVRFSNRNLRCSEIHKKVATVVGGHFSQRVQPILLAAPDADISNTPRGRFDHEVEKGVGFLIDIISHRKIKFTARCG